MQSIAQSRHSFIGLLTLSVLMLFTVGAPVWAQRPPLIDRKFFFGEPEIAGAQISPDGAFVAYAVNPADAPASGQDVPAARNLTDVKGVRAIIYLVPRTEPDAIYVGINDRDAAWQDLYKVRISTGERTLIRKNTERITAAGYGKKFIDSGNKQWRDKMQDDITRGAKYLVAQGIADPKRIGIMGGSYGGYATLAGVTFTPDVYSAAVSIVGPSNLITLLRQSQLTSPAKIKTPLLVVQGANASSDLPKPAVDLRPGTYNYKASIALGGQVIPLTTKTDVKEENGAWTVNETNRTPQGEMSNVSTIEKGSLLLKRRLIKQGPVTIEMNVAPTKVSGSTTMNGHTSRFDADPGGALFADGAGTFEVIASLPLADGYSLSFRNFDVLKQKPQIKQLKVLGSETVTVPAGMFDAYKVEIVAADNGADKQTVWIDKASRKVLKISAVLTWLEGAVLTSELTP